MGAGDAFHGAFCSGLINQLSFRDNMLLSSAAGAICCQGLGARETLPDMTTVMNFMAGQPKPEIRRL
ncbi:PfkB family carbohydrate kinase [Endozoicomonas atrinae]